MAIINQGDQYKLPVKIIADGQPVTPTEADDIRVQVGELLKSYVDGELEFDADTANWLFPLTEEFTQSMEHIQVPVQVGVKNGDEYMYSATQLLNLNKSIIKESWD